MAIFLTTTSHLPIFSTSSTAKPSRSLLTTTSPRSIHCCLLKSTNSTSNVTSNSHPLLKSLRSAASAAIFFSAAAFMIHPNTCLANQVLTSESSETSTQSAESITPETKIGRLEKALEADPKNFEALFHVALLLDREAALEKLNQALEKAVPESREARLMEGQVLFLRKEVDEAVGVFEELAAEDAGDYRPVFCQWVIFGLVGKDEEAKEKFVKLKEIAPEQDFDVGMYLQKHLLKQQEEDEE